MSSFLDRWLYRDNKSAHNVGTRNGNAGSFYSQTGAKQSTPYYPEGGAAYPRRASGGTAPNLQNVPWSYYKNVETHRRGSAGSMEAMGPVEPVERLDPMERVKAAAHAEALGGAEMPVGATAQVRARPVGMDAAGAILPDVVRRPSGASSVSSTENE